MTWVKGKLLKTDRSAEVYLPTDASLISGLGKAATSNSYNDLDDLPTIPNPVVANPESTSTTLLNYITINGVTYKLYNGAGDVSRVTVIANNAYNAANDAANGVLENAANIENIAKDLTNLIAKEAADITNVANDITNTNAIAKNAYNAANDAISSAKSANNKAAINADDIANLTTKEAADITNISNDITNISKNLANTNTTVSKIKDDLDEKETEIQDVLNVANHAYNQANAAYTYADQASDIANTALNAANTNNLAIKEINDTTIPAVEEKAQNAYDTANAALEAANSSYDYRQSTVKITGSNFKLYLNLRDNRLQAITNAVDLKRLLAGSYNYMTSCSGILDGKLILGAQFNQTNVDVEYFDGQDWSKETVLQYATASLVFWINGKALPEE